MRSRSTGKRCVRSIAPSRATCRGGASEVYLHEMPGGQFTNLKEQARSLGLESRWHQVAQNLCRREPDVRRHREGDSVLQGRWRHGAGHGSRLVSPLPMSKTRARDIAFPDSVVRVLRGDLGQPPGGFPEQTAEEGAEGRGRRLPSGRARSSSRPSTSRPSARRSAKEPAR